MKTGTTITLLVLTALLWPRKAKAGDLGRTEPPNPVRVPPCGDIGDVDGDGVVSTADAELAAAYVILRRSNLPAPMSTATAR
jgi:hypothetical protein